MRTLKARTFAARSFNARTLQGVEPQADAPTPGGHGGFPHGKSRLSPLRSQPPRVVQTYTHVNAAALALLLMDAI